MRTYQGHYNQMHRNLLVSGPMDSTLHARGDGGVCGCDRFKSGSIGDVIKAIVKKDGYRGLMRGWVPRMLFHSPAAAISWSTYEASKSFFQKLNRNSNSDNVT
ncbi:hypothetical protein OIU85_001549 [Salix viminalis]|uniref:Mitoferrin n=1 Tax=Salix viminalis TaxID=40686 RepID=A0A9Q0VLN7_SALVM|nr:hypothetical protein OIU85_001549 [Salix viminalis]